MFKNAAKQYAETYISQNLPSRIEKPDFGLVYVIFFSENCISANKKV